MSNFRQITTKLMLARTISYFGSSFSDLILPLFIYETTKSPLLMGFQWSIGAISKLVAAKINGQFHIGKTNKSAILILDVLQAISVLMLLAFWRSYPSVGIMLSGFLVSFLVTLQSGYIESLIVSICKNEPDQQSARTWVNASLDKGKNFGLFLGYLTAWLASTYAGYKIAIILDSLTFLLSAAITLTIIDNEVFSIKNKIQGSYSLLFKNKEISLLTVSQALLSFSIFIFNGAFIYIMKSYFNAPDGAVAALLVFQALVYIFGSSLASKFNSISLNAHVILRFLYCLIFSGFAWSSNYYQFIILNGALSLLISFTQPTIISIFQSHTNQENSRSMGTARTSIMAISGSIGSAVCGMVLAHFHFKFVFLLAAFFTGIGSFLFLQMTRLQIPKLKLLNEKIGVLNR